jgi:hypothetical protein
MGGTTAMKIFSGSVAAASKTVTFASWSGVTAIPFSVKVTCAVSFRANGVRGVVSPGGLFYAEVGTASAVSIAVVSDSGNLGQTDIVGIY